MVQVDLITGFLGAGKTTFLRRYAAYLTAQGHHVCILENDFGAVNVDAKMETMREILANVPDNNLEWQGYSRLLETNIRKTSK